MGIKRFIKNLIKDYKFKKINKKKPIELLTAKSITDKRISFPIHENPRVSIIIPVYNEINYTLNCLYSLYQANEDVEYEIIIVNDCSTDNTIDYLSKINGLYTITNTENLGFVRSVNKGIQQARGEFIYLLNNDTIVQPNFLDSLISVFKNNNNVGAVGSKLIYPNNILQEAGCFIYKDQHIVNLGRGKSPDNPEFNFLRKVDYCSGCSLLFKKINTSGKINLLDEVYSPAYYEETDFCIRLKHKEGLDVYYQPQSVIIHFENISHQSEKVSESKTKLMEKNASVFYKRWNENFVEPMVVENRLNINTKYRNPAILFVETYFPIFDNDSGANRIIEIMRFLAKKDYKIYLITMNEEEKDESYLKLYESYGIHVIRDYVNEKGKIITQKAQLKDLDALIDKVWISRIDTFHYFTMYYKQFMAKNKPIIYDMVDFQYLRLKRESSLNDIQIRNDELEAHKAQEMSAIHNSDQVVAISETEKEFLINEDIKSNKITVISNIHELIVTKDAPNFENRKGVIFIGGGKHSPNVDAILFLHEIMLEVWKICPEIEVDIIGGHMPERILKLHSENFRILGFVKDVKPYFLNSKLMVAPLRFGAGVKGKIGQALEYSLPVVTTEIGAEGMQLTDGETALVSENHNIKKLANDIIKLHETKNIWEKLNNNSKQAIYPFTTEGQQKEIFGLLNGK